jgi:hypothetical protein
MICPLKFQNKEEKKEKKEVKIQDTVDPVGRSRFTI